MGVPADMLLLVARFRFTQQDAMTIWAFGGSPAVAVAVITTAAAFYQEPQDTATQTPGPGDGQPGSLTVKGGHAHEMVG